MAPKSFKVLFIFAINIPRDNWVNYSRTINFVTCFISVVSCPCNLQNTNFVSACKLMGSFSVFCLILIFDFKLSFLTKIKIITKVILKCSALYDLMKIANFRRFYAPISFEEFYFYSAIQNNLKYHRPSFYKANHPELLMCLMKNLFNIFAT